MIEWVRVHQLRDEIGEDDFSEVVDLFLAEVEEVATRLRADPDPARLESDLHFLKGSAMNLGFAHFSALCQQGERCAATGRPAEVNLHEILTGFELSRALFLAELPSQLAG
ncbi:Hpt domain-containing protein [Seohaeicola nanhaiensis]|uniref:Hpt domain-containing protein n=1 Tax=Seohaeicola nanhaiensis TaxID=1387282 RepID=A0ABV9KFX2_9RHOB